VSFVSFVVTLRAFRNRSKYSKARHSQDALNRIRIANRRVQRVHPGEQLRDHHCA